MYLIAETFIESLKHAQSGTKSITTEQLKGLILFASDSRLVSFALIFAGLPRSAFPKVSFGCEED